MFRVKLKMGSSRLEVVCCFRGEVSSVVWIVYYVQWVDGPENFGE